MRLACRALAIVAAGVLAYLAVTAVQVWLTAHRDDARPAQAIVVMGSAQYDGVPSPDLAARLEHALALWRQGMAPTIVVTGGRLPGDHYSESGVSAAYLESRGVPRSGTIIEVGGNNSWQSLSLASGVLESRGDRRVILVSDGFHSARIAAISQAVGLSAYTSPATSSPIGGLRAVPYFAKETIGMALGRVIGFNHLTALHRTVDLAEGALSVR